MQTADSVAESPKPQEHQLTPGEQAIVRSINLRVLQAKGRIYDLQAALDSARAEFAAASSEFTGALTLMTGSNGMSCAQISTDMTKLTAR